MSSNYLFTYTKTDIAFITSELCKLHKRDASYLCIFADVIYMNMRIENLRKRNGRSFGERDRLIMSHNERKNYEIRSK